MDNNVKQFIMAQDDNWRTPTFRQNVVTKIEEAVQRSGMQVARNSSEMENHVFMKAKTREEYMNMVAKLILHVREISQPKPNQGTLNMQGPNQNQPGASPQVQTQPGQQPQGQGGNPPGMAPDPINALQNLASQGTRNQMMNMGPGQMQQQGVMGPNPGMAGMQGQMSQQGQMPQGAPQQTATNLLQTLTQRPSHMQNKLGGMGMVPNQGQMGNNMMTMVNTMNSQLQSQLAGQGMQGQMMSNMSMANSMQGQMSGVPGTVSGRNEIMCNTSVGGMGGQMQPQTMQGQIPGQMPVQMPGQMGGMTNQQMVSLGMLGGRAGGNPGRAPPPAQFLRQSPSPSAPSPLSGPSPASMGVMGGPMQSPLPIGQLGGSPSPSAPHMQHHPQQQQRGVNLGMVASPSSSLNTPVGGAASPGGEEAAYRDKVRQLSKYIEPLRRMVHRMMGEGDNAEKLTKMKNLLDILSNPSKRMPLDTLMKCEIVLEKLDFKRSEGLAGPALPGQGKEQIFNPLLEVVNNCLQAPLANHTLKRTFGSTLDALNGPELKNLPPPYKVRKLDEPTLDIPDVLQGEIARLDSRFKVSLDTMQLSGGDGAISLFAQLDEARLPCVPPLQVSVPRSYPGAAPSACIRGKGARHSQPDSFLARLERAMEARCARLPKSCSVGQLLDAWEMSVRQACAHTAIHYTPVPALGL